MLRTFFCLHLVVLCLSEPFKEVKKWKTIDFEFPSEDAKEWYQDLGYYKPDQNLPLGLEVYQDKLFITVPRLRAGVASTLNYVSLASGEESPKLIPYPNWKMNNVTELYANPKYSEIKIVNVFRSRIDNCDRLWVVDCGLEDMVGNKRYLQYPKILVFDLKTDKLLREFKLDQLSTDSLYANLAVDSDKGKCDEAFAYVADTEDSALVVYDWKNNDSWTVRHHYFRFDPFYAYYNYGGVNFSWTDGIIGVSLKNNPDDKFKTLFFNPISSLSEFKVSTQVLRNKTMALDPKNYHRFSLIGKRSESSHSTTSAIDPETGVMFYTLILKNGVGCWNTNKKYDQSTNAIVESNNDTMLYPNDLILDRNSNVWILVDQMPIFIYSKFKNDAYYARVFMSSIKDAVKGTVCEN